MGKGATGVPNYVPFMLAFGGILIGLGVGGYYVLHFHLLLPPQLPPPSFLHPCAHSSTATPCPLILLRLSSSLPPLSVHSILSPE